MFFKNPSILYAIFALIIPIVIHLFNFRKFKPLIFTNVKFLSSINSETKSIKSIKRWLLLVCRLLCVSSIIFAFSQPYLSKDKIAFKPKETLVYLDNSLSMQSKSINLPLFREYINDLIEVLPNEQRVTLFTNNKEFKNIESKYLKEKIKTLPYSINQLEYNYIRLKTEDLLSKDDQTEKELIIMSDLQIRKDSLNNILSKKFDTKFHKKPFSKNNISIDSVYISKFQPEALTISAVINTSLKSQIIPVSIYDGDELILKTNINPEITSVANFNLPNKSIKNGVIRINDNTNSFDNQFYFTLSQPSKVKVLSINDQSEDNILNSLFNNPIFDYKSIKLKKINPDVIGDSDIIILNELNNIPSLLSESLTNFSKNNGFLIFIPSLSIKKLSSYNRFFKNYNLKMTDLIDLPEEMTTINFNHNLFKGVFKKPTSNFNYPKFNSHYIITGDKKESILKFNSGDDLLISKNNLYLFSSALNSKNSNFSSSELIAPLFYNMGYFSINTNNLYYKIGLNHKITFKHKIIKDKVISIKDSINEFIPIQRSYATNSEIELNHYPSLSGHYNVIYNSNNLGILAFNNNSDESRNIYSNPDIISEIQVNDSLIKLINETKSKTNSTPLWKWFVIFALILLITEIFILKYFK